MRLIDTDAEENKINDEIKRYEKKIERLKEHRRQEPQNTCHNFEQEIENCRRNINNCKLEIRSLRRYETAYDVEKVIEQLKETKVLAQDATITEEKTAVGVLFKRI